MGNETLRNKNELIAIRAWTAIFHALGVETVSGDSKLTPVNVKQLKEAEFFLDLTAIARTTTGTFDVNILTLDPISGKWFTLVSFTQRTTVGTERKVVTGNLGAFLAAAWIPGGDTTSVTFSIGAVLKAD